MHLTTTARTAHRTPRRSIARLVLLGAAAVLTAAACTDDTGRPAAEGNGAPVAAATGAAHRPATASWLFSLDADRADVTTGPAGTSTVTMVEPGDVLAFTDRPVRHSERLVTTWFSGNFQHLFGQDPPNAVLTGMADGRAVEVAVEVRAVTGDRNALTATVHGIGDDEHTVIPATLTDAALFIDDTIVVPSDATLWTYHSMIPTGPDSDRYVARVQLRRDGLTPSESNFIYSFPAIALVEGFQDHHVDIDREPGIALFDHAATDGP
jgi:hypothetical protein